MLFHINMRDFQGQIDLMHGIDVRIWIVLGGVAFFIKASDRRRSLIQIGIKFNDARAHYRGLDRIPAFKWVKSFA